jgi:hypothetical protein
MSTPQSTGAYPPLWITQKRKSSTFGDALSCLESDALKDVLTNTKNRVLTSLVKAAREGNTIDL